MFEQGLELDFVMQDSMLPLEESELLLTRERGLKAVCAWCFGVCSSKKFCYTYERLFILSYLILCFVAFRREMRIRFGGYS